MQMSSEPAMVHKVRIGTEELDAHEINERFPGLNLTTPCTADRDGHDDGGSVQVSTCHILEGLSRWNYFLWHVGLQLREIRAPGKLSLVRVAYRGKGGCRQRARSEDARFLFHVLLVQHNCVESVHLEDTLIEGCGLGEFRERIVAALRNNTSLRTLTIGSLFSEYRSIREDLLGAIATMSNLRELSVLVYEAAPSVLLDTICQLLTDTTCLITLSMPRLVLNEVSGERLIAALRSNNTVQNLSVHGSIVHSRQLNGVPRFSVFLEAGMLLRSLSVHGEPYSEDAFQALEPIVAPLTRRCQIQKLRLAGYILSAQHANLFAALASDEEGHLRSLDISGCSWNDQIPAEWRLDSGAAEGDLGEDVFTDLNSLRLHTSEINAQGGLSFLALSFAGLQPDELRFLLCCVLTIESLQVISLNDVLLHDLKQVCRAVKKRAIRGRVRVEDIYVVDSAALSELQEFPEALRRVSIRSFAERSLEKLRGAVHLACSWYQVTTLSLCLRQNVVHDSSTCRTLCKYLSTADSLRELELSGDKQLDLDRSPKSAGSAHSLLLAAILKNKSVRALRLSELRLGEANLRFLVGEVVGSRTLCEFTFSSLDPVENDTFVRSLATGFQENKTITRLCVWDTTDSVDEEWFTVEDVIGRNMGHLTCAAHSVVRQTDSPRCAAAFNIVSHTPALQKKVEELQNEVGTV
ncbi:hypothetical protein HPB50_002085 [Hyalomma asiaticum]|uniref:Uncharacterized protein n=1 Tax=Hyalomma asiaticum TaxID=266040 RepID=A0ACB7T5R3_HYAAI|nr:hypothetical protein HPB50_002085 [Hyalomma asiaticum]